MKVKALRNTAYVFGLLLTLTVLGFICELIFTNHYWGIIPLVVLFGATGYAGMEYAAKVAEDPQGAVDSFMGNIEKEYPEYWKKYSHK